MPAVPAVDEVGEGWGSGAKADLRWPNVPACYGWLSLDRRGGWRLKREPIRHAGLIQHINRNYGPHEDGTWVFRNGPQTVFVELEYTPLIVRLGTDGSLRLHTGKPAGAAVAAFVDDEGNVLIKVEGGVALLDDRDLAGFVDGCRSPDGSGLAEFPSSLTPGGAVQAQWQGLALQPVARRDVPVFFGFNPEPQPGRPRTSSA